MNQIDLQGNRAVVTGGAQGIGYAIAERLLQSGATVCLWDRDADLIEQAAEQLSASGTVHQAVVDMTDLTGLEAATVSTSEALGGIDIFVANAGIAGPTVKLWEYPPEAWREVLDIDLTGVFNCLRAVVPGMITQNYGRIVNVASVAGKDGNPNACAYSAAKAGVIGFTKAVAREVASRSVTVNALAPGFVTTGMVEEMPEKKMMLNLSR